MSYTKILSKQLALFYLFNEFDTSSLKVTTVLDDNGCWTGKVILESTDEEPKDNNEMASFYLNYYKTLDK